MMIRNFNSKQLLTSILLLLSYPILFAQNNGILEGRIYNANNNEPLAFATIAIFGTTIGSTSDLDGRFLLTGLKPGFVELRASSVGFETYISEAIQVTNARKAFIEIPLQEANLKLEEVTIKASPFRKSDESPVSLRRIDIAEIEKNPGGNRDISRVIQSYPGVASSPAFRNDIIVRGGGTSENRFYLDGVEIPNINHFATQGASGGPIGIINVDFIREVDFYSGAFPADRGNALSSILELKQIDGNKDKIRFKAAIGASDLGLTVDGPLGDKTTFIASARRSYLQLLFSVIGLPFLPTYNDFQFKVKTRFDDKNELTLIGLGALDQFRLNLDADETEEQQYILGFLPVNEQWTYTLGAVYKHFRDNGYDTWVLSRNHLNNKVYKYFNNIERDSLKTIDYNSDEVETKFRYEYSGNLSNRMKLNYGANLEHAYYYNSTFKKNFINGLPVIIDYNSDLNIIKWGVFGQLSQEFLKDRLTLSLGLRMDAANYSKEMNNLIEQFSPRFSASYRITSGFYFNFNTGRYYQLPAYTSLGFRNKAGDLVNNQNGLSYIESDHLVGGFEWRPSEKSRLTLEGFYKYYRNYPFSVNDSISISSKGGGYGIYGDEELKSIALGRAYGFELLYRNKDLFGGNLILSYTFVKSEAESAITAGESGNHWVPTAWDNRHLLNILAIKQFDNNWRVGLKWRFIGGAPYTPFDGPESSYVLAWNTRGIGIPDYSRFNSQRLGSFHQLDFRIDKEFFLKNVTLNFYVDIQNLYNFKSDQQKVLVLDNSKSQPINPTAPPDQQKYALKELPLKSGTVLPAFGIIVEF